MGVVGIFGRMPNELATEHLKHEFQVDDHRGWRMFSKPYNVENYNWQMYFPWEEKSALPNNKEMLDHIVHELSARAWDSQYIDFVKCTDPETMRCGLLYDRDPLAPLAGQGAVTYIGDAAHPVSPYKGRGANLALWGIQTFTRIAKEAIELSATQNTKVDWEAVNRAYEAKHWPCAGKVQTSCRQSVWEHHFAPSDFK